MTANVSRRNRAHNTKPNPPFHKTVVPRRKRPCITFGRSRRRPRTAKESVSEWRFRFFVRLPHATGPDDLQTRQPRAIRTDVYNIFRNMSFGRSASRTRDESQGDRRHFQSITVAIRFTLFRCLEVYCVFGVNVNVRLVLPRENMAHHQPAW